MTRLRPLSGLLLALLMAVTSVTMAVARSETPMSVQRMELCAGMDTRTVLVDSEGNPVAPRHPCPECLVGLTAFTLLDPAPLPERPETRARNLHPEPVLAQPGRPAPSAKARAPPVLS